MRALTQQFSNFKSSMQSKSISAGLTEYDFLIVGQGIAGTVLTHTLLEQGKRILVIDEGNPSSCSKVAAGLYNPIVFKRLTKSWMIDELSPVAENFYKGL